MSCTGPRNIYSSSPLIAPFPVPKHNTSIEANYFTHTRQPNVGDSVAETRDNCFNVTVSRALWPKILLFTYADISKEHYRFRDSISVLNNPDFYSYDAGFDSSVVLAKRFVVSGGLEFFSDNRGKNSRSFAVAVALRRLNMNESGLLMRAPYIRFYRLNQVSLSLQQGFLFRPWTNFRIAWIVRLTALKNFQAKTDYTDEEKFRAGMRDKTLNLLAGFTGVYADYRPLKKIPLFITGQFFNDLSFWNHSFAKYEPGRIYIKGTGASTGLKYFFR
jgi:hypothetical protein